MKFEVESKFNKGDKVIGTYLSTKYKLVIIDVKWSSNAGYFIYLCEEKNRERRWFPEGSLEEDK